ncbi:MAG: urease subunit alpha [Bifidobacteriaceae bacterium]|jgi:urease subunit alpha|nr:urease subunit alpha [Bifidobacteriaceae bacterium]
MKAMRPVEHASVFGPRLGDRFRLADTQLIAQVEQDFTLDGLQLIAGAGKSFRDSEGLAADVTAEQGALDLVIQNVVVIDAVAGIVKADVGIKDGLIVGIGRAGNPACMPGITPGLIVGHATTPINGHDLILTAGTIESHAHMQSPEQSEACLAGGTTTIIGSAVGPVFEVGAGTPFQMARFLQGAETSPVNYGLLVRGGSNSAAVEAAVAGGALGVKVHEDFGASPAVIDASLRAADQHDFPVHLHTDSINEFGFAEDTMAAVAGRTIHMYHVEGAGGGHAPDLLRVVSYSNVIPASTNPTNPFTPACLEEGMPMTMIAHNMNPAAPEDVAFAESRVRGATMAAEDYLHDIGAISIFGTDTQGMGRLAENTAKCWQLASVMRDRYGPLPEEARTGADNERIKRYIAKLTINPAIAVGIDQYVGSVETGKIADLVLWPRSSFAVKPRLIIKGGAVVWAAMGDANGSIALSEPVIQRPMWGGLGRAAALSSAVFVSQWAVQSGACEAMGIAKRILPITSTRHLTKADMVRNQALPEVLVDPSTFEVRVDGELLDAVPALEVPLNRRYLLR